MNDPLDVFLAYVGDQERLRLLRSHAGKAGGSKKSAAKTAAARKNARDYWSPSARFFRQVKAGHALLPAPNEQCFCKSGKRFKRCCQAAYKSQAL